MKKKKVLVTAISSLLFFSATGLTTLAEEKNITTNTVLEWNQELYNEIEMKVNDNIPSTKKSNQKYDITKNKYSHLIKTVEEEYFTHPDGPYWGTKDELKKDKEYIEKALIRNTQDVTYYGDVIQYVIDEAHKSGGGRVIIPGSKDPNNPKVYYTGAIELKSNVILDIQENAVLKFVRNKTNEYYPVVYTRWEGVELMNYSPFIYAYEAENIAITGKGTLDGQADEFNWMPWKYGYFQEDNQKIERNRLFGLGQDGADVEKERIFTDETSTLRPPFIQPYKSKNILIEDITIVNSPFWEVNPVLCENVKVDGITIDTQLYNNDGVDPESSKDVIIENSFFSTGDDCIAIKSGRNNDGRRISVPSENIIIRNNKFEDGHGGITMGSEISGGVKNVLAHNNFFDSEELDYPIRFKTNAERGATIENIYIKDSTINKSKIAVIHADFFYEEGLEGNYTPVLRNIALTNIKTVDGGSIDAKNALYLKGFEHSPIENILLKDVELNGVKNGPLLQNVKGLTYDNVSINGEKLDNQTINVDNEGNVTK